MRSRTCVALLLLVVTACATTEPSVSRSPRHANLQRAATLPWRDDGRCVVREASGPWSEVVEQCFPALDTRRVRFRDIKHRCPVAMTDAASLEMVVGVCLLTQPELAVGAVVVIGVVVVAIAIKEELDAYELRHAYPDEDAPRTRPLTRQPVAEHNPEPAGSASGRDWFPPPGPPGSVDPRERRPECRPQAVSHLGGDALHNQCADRVPSNDFAGSDVLINGKHFDAMQLRAGVLWEIKTDNFDTFTPALQRIVLGKQVDELQRERNIAKACGYKFVVGVRSAAHKAALLSQIRDLTIVVMDWC
ncbi:DUF6310 domain-containing protein [Corallococcus aberystwythensis]|uniref:DUF6310 domain-containing protein n=1 Tax=Corallococcus aberystwythensis TaxID=2316722 RepID=A0A3A8QTD0_9BACT|nr:DUF6310 domain-containing protein [Corallococcus aberystwythensis]RKH72059.1 hypothetical protein D7W81_06425 [Corallococcus aberystwythensis]